jgi:type 1 glutamine amidotransferase
VSRLLLIAACALALEAAPRRVLYVTHTAGYRHDSIPASHEAMRRVAARSGALEVVGTEDLSFLTAERLREFDAVFFFTSGELALSDAQKRDLISFVREGKGFGGAHSATDTFYSWPEYGELIGAYFDGHPWAQEVRVDVEDPEHPATRRLGSGFVIADEIYQFRGFSRDRVRVLLALNERSVDLRAPEVRGSEGEFPLAWCHSYGQGRVFYTALGHGDETWNDARFQDLLEGALLWLTGEAASDASPRRAAPAVAGVLRAGEYLEIYGTGLTSGSTMQAPAGAPKLAGVSVLINGAPVPVLYASPAQVNVHAPTPGQVTFQAPGAASLTVDAP